MKKRLFKVIGLLIIVSVLGYFSRNDLFRVSTVRAFGALTVNFHVPVGNPIFTVTNMAPGGTENRNIDVTNGGATGSLVAIKGVRTGGVGADPKLETVLDITIKDGATTLYGSGSATGAKTVKDFFTDSNTANGIQLNAIAAGGSKTYNIKVTFPTNAGNEFQNKSVIFDLTFGEITGDHVVINEVFYNVDAAHGMDSPKDRGIVDVNGNNVTILIQGNGAGSVNKVKVNQSQACNITQSNNTTIVNGVTVISNTGGNKANGNTGGTTNITTGNVQSIISIVNGGSSNTATGCGGNSGKKLGQNDEWVELFNPTDHDISLKNWTLTDNSSTIKINANKIIKAGGFALLSKDASTWTLWTENPAATKIELGNQIGDGLDDAGDHLILKNNTNVEVDRMSWGTDTSGFTPSAINPAVVPGHSTSRTAPGVDTDTVGDWFDNLLPNPGS